MSVLEVKLFWFLFQAQVHGARLHLLGPSFSHPVPSIR